jgi:glycosyltransferase involved in cell wall biosynthesis
MKKVRLPRILILLENHIYPNDVRVKPHAESLAASGYDVTVISPGGMGYAGSETTNGVKIYRYPAWFAESTKKAYVAEYLLSAFFITLLALWVWIRHGLDVLLFYNPPDILWICGLLPKLFVKTLVFDIRDLAPELFKSKFVGGTPILSKALGWMEFLSCRVANHVIVTNETSRQVICQRNKLDPKHMTVIRQGPDTETIAPRSPDPVLRARAEIIIGYLGNMAPERGIGNLLQALKHLKYDLGYDNWICVLIGRPTAALNLEKMAADLGIAENILLTGFLPQEKWVSVLSAADICVDPGASNPGNDVSTTNKMMDYMALEKPVVAFELPERYSTAGDTALYAHSNDNHDLASKIAVLIDSPELRQKLGHAGRERVLNQLAWQYQRSLLLALFDQLTYKQISYGEKRTTKA